MRTSVNKGKCCACLRTSRSTVIRLVSLSLIPPINSHSTETEKRVTHPPSSCAKKRIHMDQVSSYLSLSLSLSLYHSSFLHSFVPPRRILPLSLISCCKGIVQELHLDTHSISPLTYHFHHHEGEESYESHLVISHVP